MPIREQPAVMMAVPQPRIVPDLQRPAGNGILRQETQRAVVKEGVK
jgi:hypothetical protein